ncbi:MAG: hypothetical protein AAF357_01250 [Verrucomicrobiota bacterium]
MENEVLSWNSRADLESGLSHFLIKRDGELLAKVPKESKNRFGRPLFQGLQYSDTPTVPLAEMHFRDLSAPEGITAESYEVIAVNTVGLSSD